MTQTALELARRLDWRFLLPSPRLGRVVCLGELDAALRDALQADAADVADPESARAGLYDLAVVGGGSPDLAREATALLRPGGWIYAETSGKRRHAVEAALAEEGFDGIASFWHWPRFAACAEIVPLDDPAAMRAALARRQARSRSRAKAAAARLLAAAGRLDQAIPCASVLGRRPDGERVPPSFTRALVGGLEEARELGFGGAGGLLVTPRFPTSRHVVGLMVPDEASEPSLVLKIPRLASDRAGVEHEQAVLQLLHEETPGGHGGAPRLVAFLQREGWPALVETALHGAPLNPRAVRRDPDRALGAVLAWLASLPRREASEKGFYERLLGTPLSTYAESAGREGMLMVEETRRLTAPLREATLPLVFEHGDLSHPNLVLQRDGSLGVIDWELAEPYGLPLNDLCFFLGYLASCRDGAADATGAAAFVRAFVGRDAWGGKVVLAEADRAGVPRRLVEPLFHATWARDAARFPVRADVEGAQAADSRPRVRWRLALEHAGALGWI